MRAKSESSTAENGTVEGGTSKSGTTESGTAETGTVEPIPAPARQLDPGTLLGGRYRLGPVLGRGGFGVVQRARDLRLDQEVALKLIHPARLEGTSFERLRREVKLAREADSERLVDVFDLDQADGRVFLVMELVEGRSLRQLMDEEAPFDIEGAVGLASELLRALGDLHKRGVLHRDVKPANVLIDRAGEVRLADFGLARSLHQEAQLTDSGAVLGTAAYLFPERGRRLTPAADLYSFGVVLFEMLTGRLPFEAGDPVDLVKAHLQEPPPEVRGLRPEVPAWLADMVARLLEKRPDDRYQSAEQVLAAFDRRAGRRARRHGVRWQVAAAAVAAIALVWLLWPTAPRRQPAVAKVELDTAVTVTDQDGGVLGILPAAADSAGVLRIGGERWVAVIRDGEPEGGGPTPYTLSLYDPRLELAHVEELPLGPAVHVFASLGFAATYGSVMQPLDVDHDGDDELFIGFLHTTHYPSTTALYEPARRRFREIFRATGHHRVIGVADFNGDGGKDVLIAGINNRLGYASYIAAQDIQPPVALPGIPDSRALGSNPTANLHTGPRRNLLFYAVTELDGCLELGPECIEIDVEAQRIRWHHSLRIGLIELDFQGLRLDVAAAASPAERVEARRQAFRSYRRAVSLERQGELDSARSSYLEALAKSELAGEPYLSRWLKMCAGVAAMAGSSSTLGRGELDQLLSQIEPVTAAELAFEAGRKLHRLGRVEVALTLYRHAFGLSHSEDERARWELVQSMVLAHLEKGSVDAASQLLDDYHRRDPTNREHQDALRAYLDWRAGGPPRRAEVNRNSPDLFRYWGFELGQLAEPGGTREALAELDGMLANSSETRGALLARRAELLLAQNRPGEARGACILAREWYATLGTRWIPARLLEADYESRCAGVLANKVASD